MDQALCEVPHTRVNFLTPRSCPVKDVLLMSPFCVVPLWGDDAGEEPNCGGS